MFERAVIISSVHSDHDAAGSFQSYILFSIGGINPANCMYVCCWDKTTAIHLHTFSRKNISTGFIILALAELKNASFHRGGPWLVPINHSVISLRKNPFMASMATRRH